MFFHQSFKISTLMEAPERRQETLSLIEKAFKYSQPHQFAIDFYPLINPHNAQNCHIIIDPRTDRVIAHSAVLMRTLGNHGFKTNVAVFGGIAVDENYQRQGIMANLMRYLINEYQEDTGLFILWSDLHSLYAKHRFYRCGGQIQLGDRQLDLDLEQKFCKKKFSQLEKSELEQIKMIYQDQLLQWNTSFFRSKQDWDAILNIESADIFLYKIDGGRIGGYFIANKGFDLQDIIHEVGYLAECKHYLLEALSPYRTWINEQERLFFPNAQLLFAALMRIGSPVIFSQFIRQWSQGEITINSVDEHSVCFDFQHQNYQEDIEHFLTNIFGPCPIKEFEKFGPPLYLSGLDSV